MVQKGSEFEQICKKILELNHFTIQEFNGPADIGFDFILSTEDPRRKIAVEVKFYRSDFISPKILETAVVSFINSVKKHKIYEAILIISSKLHYELRGWIESEFNLSIFDRSDLFSLAASNTNILSRLKEIIESDYPEVLKGEEEIINKIKNKQNTLTGDIQLKHENYCKELKLIKPGIAFKKYELLIEKILKYLFSESLNGWHRQNRTDDGINIQDLICRVTPGKYLWDFLAQELGSRYILFEFKNYTEEITQAQIFTTERYLLEKAKRTVGFIITRKGITKHGIVATKGAIRENGKLLIVLNDNDICEMVKLRNNGFDPSDYLFEKIDNFFLSLSR